MRALVLALILTSQPAAPTEELRVVTGSGLRVRADADPTSAVLERLPLGTVVPCLERSGEATVGEQKGRFCRTELADGRQGWFFEPLTRSFDPARPEEAWSAIVAERAAALEGCSADRKEDVWGYHRFLLDRAAEAKDPAARARWELLELRLVRAQACLFFGGDARIYRDEAQGPRLERKAIWSFVDRVRGTPSSEEAAWMAVEHGRDFECEGFLPCLLDWHKSVECEYLKRFPEAPRAGKASQQIGATADEVTAQAKKGELDAESAGLILQTLPQLERCLKPIEGREARAARESLAKAGEAAHRASQRK